MPSENASLDDWGKYKMALCIYGLQKGQIKQKLGLSPKEKLIKLFEDGNNNGFHLENETIKQKTIMYPKYGY